MENNADVNILKGEIMFVRIFVILLMALCFVSFTACGAPRDGADKIAGKSIDEVAEEVFAPAAEVEREILSSDYTPPPPPEFIEPGAPNVEFPEDPVEGGEEIAGYAFPGASASAFEVSANDPLTGKSWDDLTGIIETSKGTVKIKFFHDVAPRHVENFVYLARAAFYNGLNFHRYEEGFVIQGGDPDGDGSGGPGYTLPSEFNENNHVVGIVSAARQGDEMNPTQRSSGSQFYIMIGDAPHLDGGYTAWGQVVEGMDDVVMELRKGDVINSITVE
jgi:peptidyl-prolyl cis-trans isomerase B (cyclophilin B)